MADRIGYLDGGPDVRHLAFVDPAGTTLAQVDTHTGRETGWRFARCETCGWNVHGPERDEIDERADTHFNDHLTEKGLR